MPKNNILTSVGPWHRGEAVANYDAGIVHVNSTSLWRPGPHVLVRQSSGAYPTNEAQIYIIRSVGSQPPINSYLCQTGASSWTVCGRVMQLGFNPPGYDTQNLGRLDIYGCQGDSGGPIFVTNIGYGLVSGGPNATTASRNYYPGRTETVWCGPETWYQGLGGAQAAMNVDILLG